MILSIQYITPEQDLVRVETDDMVYNTKIPCNTWHKEEIEEWLMTHNIHPYVAPEVSYPVSKLQIIDRLHNANLLEYAFQVLEQDFHLYHRWLAASYIDSNDPDTIQFLNFIGADPDIILAP